MDRSSCRMAKAIVFDFLPTPTRCQRGVSDRKSPLGFVGQGSSFTAVSFVVCSCGGRRKNCPSQTRNLTRQACNVQDSNYSFTILLYEFVSWAWCYCTNKGVPFTRERVIEQVVIGRRRQRRTWSDRQREHWFVIMAKELETQWENSFLDLRLR